MELLVRITSVALVTYINNADIWPCSTGDVKENCSIGYEVHRAENDPLNR